MNAKSNHPERRSRDTRPLPAWRDATPCKAALLFLALAAVAASADPATNAPAATPAAVRQNDRPAIAGLAVTNDGDGMVLTEEAVMRLSQTIRKGKRIDRKPLAWEGRGRFPVEETSVYVRTVKNVPEAFEKQYEFSWGYRFVEVTSRFIPIKTTVIHHETCVEFVEEPKGPFLFELDRDAQDEVAKILYPFKTEEQEKAFYFDGMLLEYVPDWRHKIEPWVETDETLGIVLASPTNAPATPSAAEENHAESAENAEPETHAEPAERAE